MLVFFRKFKADQTSKELNACPSRSLIRLSIMVAGAWARIVATSTKNLSNGIVARAPIAAAEATAEIFVDLKSANQKNVESFL
jgi:hypothetical protein